MYFTHEMDYALYGILFFKMYDIRTLMTKATNWSSNANKILISYNIYCTEITVMLH